MATAREPFEGDLPDAVLDGAAAETILAVGRSRAGDALHLAWVSARDDDAETAERCGEAAAAHYRAVIDEIGSIAQAAPDDPWHVLPCAGR
jgi:hypothetical protein